MRTEDLVTTFRTLQAMFAELRHADASEAAKLTEAMRLTEGFGAQEAGDYDQWRALVDADDEARTSEG